MTTNTVVDRYYLEHLERLSEPDSSPTPIRAIAVNTADPSKTAEAWWSRETTRTNLLLAGAAPHEVDWYLQQLDDHGQVKLETNVPGTRAKPPIFDAHELVRMGFPPDDLEL